uniref:Putative ovule protein n=1 Tax=Solanum chacoense TaxID=4108 RepID=A0A0V0HFP6_SOLCH
MSNPPNPCGCNNNFIESEQHKTMVPSKQSNQRRESYGSTMHNPTDELNVPLAKKIYALMTWNNLCRYKILNYNSNNIPSVIPQVACGEDRVYADLTTTLGGREVVSARPLAQ